jgi:hypothetical protein
MRITLPESGQFPTRNSVDGWFSFLPENKSTNGNYRMGRDHERTLNDCSSINNRIVARSIGKLSNRELFWTNSG